MHTVSKRHYSDEFGVISEVHQGQDGWWHVSMKGGLCFGIDPKYGREPKVGDTVKLVCYGGSGIAGIYINDEKVFHKTDDELDKEHEEYVENQRKEKQAQFDNDKDRLDADYESLPGVFKARIDRFRAARETWRWEYESYEMFCCTQAVILANHFESPKAIKAFKDFSFDAQKAANIKGLELEAHSGNTFGCAVALARLYTGPEPSLVARWHGALCGLVGCDDYGCREQDRRKPLEAAL